MKNTLLACAAMLALGATAASAATFHGTIREYDDRRGNDYTTVGYHTFSVTGGEYSFDILSNGVLGGNASGWRSGLDSAIRVFNYNSRSRHNLGSQVAYNDDGGSAGAGDGSTSGLDSYLTTYLDAGQYVVAVGDYFFGMNDARNGYNYGSMPGTYARYQLTVSEVPLPASALLLLGGLAGLGVMRKRKS